MTRGRMNVRQWPDTSTPSSLSCSCVTKFSGRIKDFSWIGIATSRTQPARLAEHIRCSVDQLEAGAAGFGIDRIEAEEATRVGHRILLAAEIGTQILAAPVVDIEGVDVRAQQIDVERQLAKYAVISKKSFKFLAQHRERGKIVLDRDGRGRVAVPDLAQHPGIDAPIPHPSCHQ